ncbi:MAG: MBL fold metallo-hydrolase [Deltaproteobacteria bacterium]|nr:MBL fold metallo-hydrolase [Deltaproteobacteria bacterium]
MQVGRWQVSTLLDGTFGLDGGSMFGIVPRALWSGRHPPDDRNRITMALRCLLLTDGQRRILVDAGIGDRLDDHQRDIYRYERADGGLCASLAAFDLEPGDMTDVVLTHLHFDHAGGLLKADGQGGLEPVFPAACVHVQEEAWSWARGHSVWDQGSFFPADFDVWEEKLDLHLLQGDAEIGEGVRVQVTEGHTPGHQLVLIGQGRGSLCFCADLIPTATHVRLPYIMAFDHLPLRTLEEKRVLLAQAVEEGWILVFGHDPFTVACKLCVHDDRVVTGESVVLNTEA